LAGDDPHKLYYAACAYALCATYGADADETALADEALSVLNQAVANGFKDLARLNRDPDLDGLRDREDFQKLVSQLTEK
jgi:hypothetical protein